MTIKKQYCGHCRHINRQERWCYLRNVQRRLLERPCAEFMLREGLTLGTD